MRNVVESIRRRHFWRALRLWWRFGMWPQYDRRRPYRTGRCKPTTPLRICPLCGGSGQHYLTLDGGRCFGCNGTGIAIPERMSDVYGAYQGAKRVAELRKE